MDYHHSKPLTVIISKLIDIGHGDYAFLFLNFVYFFINLLYSTWTNNI